MFDIFFNGYYFSITVLLIVFYRRNKISLWGAFCLEILFGVIGIWLFMEDLFSILRILSWILFVYFPVCGLFITFTLWESNKFFSRLFLVLGVIVSLIGAYSFFIEPKDIQLTHYKIYSEKVEKPLRIAVISDIQTDEVSDYEAKVLQLAWNNKPDLVLFPGDYLQSPDNYNKEAESFTKILKDHAAETAYGSWAVRGDVDRGKWTDLFKGTNVNARKESFSIALNDELYLTGLGIKDSFENSFSIHETDQFHIVFGHRPDFSLGNIKADLLIAGHTHGGQVNLPIVGPLITLSGIPKDWAHGMTQIGDDKYLVVSKGIGMERGNAPRLRFLCRPEVILIDVLPVD